jgi:hypothetical protein
MVALGNMPSEALQTADFCVKVNDLFDVMNSVSQSGGLKAVTKRKFFDERIAFLESGLIFVKSWHFCSRRQGRFKDILFHHAWQISVSAIRNLLIELMQRRGLSYVATRRFCQDPVEVNLQNFCIPQTQYPCR